MAVKGNMAHRVAGNFYHSKLVFIIKHRHLITFDQIAIRKRLVIALRDKNLTMIAIF